jgi:hypothetical protein
MLTNGVSDRPIMDKANWHNLVEKSALDQIVVRNYPTKQEVWIGYPPKGSSVVTKALIADYSTFAQRGAGIGYGSTETLGIRVTGPVDVRMDDAFLGFCSDGPRFYLASNGGVGVYVQDSGSIDAQQNTNAAGDIELEWDVPAVRLGGSVFRTGQAARVAVEGHSGSAKTFDVNVVVTDGVEEYSEADVLQIGPGETDDAATAALTGNSHRLEIGYTGPTGSTYDEADPDCAPRLSAVTWEVEAIGRQKRMSGA